jgi:alpha-1,2-mannosyltransferase
VTTHFAAVSARRRDRAGSRSAEPGPRPAGPSPARRAWRPAARRWRVLLAAVNLAALAFFLLSFSAHGVAFGHYRIDLDVYRIGGRVWLRGGNLYGPLPATASGVRLPFSYPPAAAILLSPLALVPMAVAGTLLTLATVAAAAAVLLVFLRSLGGTVGGTGGGAVSSPGSGVSWWAVGWLLPAALFLEPVRSTLGYGQVNVVLMALVTLDCLSAKARWPRGALVGIAAAVKLTPGAFALYFLLRRDYRAAVTAAAAFAASTGAGFLLAPADSARYWTSVVFQTGRPGSPAYAANQSVQGVLARAGLDPRTPAGAALWLALSALVLALACRGMRRALAGSADAWALSLNAFAALLISPISWSHHWVWGETAVLTLAVLGRGSGRRAALVAAGCGLVVFAAAPQWWFPSGAQRELGWAAWQQVLGSSYVILAGAALLLSARSPRARGATGEGHQAGRGGPGRAAPPGASAVAIG